jgi:hypothetical protein
MRDFNTPRTYILSAQRYNLGPRENRARHCELACDLALEGIVFKEVRGCFEGVEEDAFVIVGSHAEPAVRLLARHWAQQSYVAVAEHDRIAYEVDVETGYHTHLGKLENIGPVKPASGAWTCVDGDYFTTNGARKGLDLPEGF